MHEKDHQKPAINNEPLFLKADGWILKVYTDPLCVWSWATWPQLERFLTLFEEPDILIKMAGLIPSWYKFSDNVNAITKAIQMGPEWMHARTITGVEVDDTIWALDPPASSYPACIAVKAAELQGKEMGKKYFEAVQQAVMTQRRNIAKMPVLHKIAEELDSWNSSQFDSGKFTNDLVGDLARQKFREDVTEWEYLRIGRLPTVVIRNNAGKGKVLSGFQTFDTLAAAVTSIA